MLIAHLLRLLEGYLHRRHTLREIELWLLANLQAILDSNDQEAIQLANQVDADLVELHEGLIDETALRENFKRYLILQPVPFEYETQTHSETGFMFSNPQVYVVGQESIPWHEAPITSHHHAVG